MDSIKKGPQSRMLSSAAIIGCSILMAYLIAGVGYYFEDALAQGNQTGNIMANQTTENKTLALGKLTRQDLDPILDNLFTAREELLRKNSPSAFDALSTASSQLFNVTTILDKDDAGTISEQLKPLQDRIERSRDVLLRNDNITAAILNLNAADTEFVKLTLKLQ